MELPLRSHTPKGARARTKILRVAERLFAAGGFHGASMRDVAEAAGLPLASVVYHFAKKEQIYGAVLAVIGEELASELADVMADVERSWSDRLGALVRRFVAWTDSNPGRVKLLLRELLDNPSRVARASKLPLAPVLHQLSAFVEAGMRAGAFRPALAETSVLHLVGALSYVVAARPTLRRIVGPARDRKIAASYEREALAFARRMFLALEPEVQIHGSEDADQPGGARAGARGGAHHRRGRGARADQARHEHLPR